MDLSSRFLPAAGTTAAFDFTERRHVPVTAQHKRYANCPVLNSGVVSAFGTKRTSRHVQPMSAFGGKVNTSVRKSAAVKLIDRKKFCELMPPTTLATGDSRASSSQGSPTSPRGVNQPAFTSCVCEQSSARSIGRFAISGVKTPQSTFRGKTSARSISPRLLMNSTIASVSSLSTVPP